MKKSTIVKILKEHIPSVTNPQWSKKDCRDRLTFDERELIVNSSGRWCITTRSGVVIIGIPPNFSYIF
jgi:uncharacterized protein YfaT (DUF1175 family)